MELISTEKIELFFFSSPGKGLLVNLYLKFQFLAHFLNFEKTLIPIFIFTKFSMDLHSKNQPEAVPISGTMFFFFWYFYNFVFMFMGNFFLPKRKQRESFIWNIILITFLSDDKEHIWNASYMLPEKKMLSHYPPFKCNFYI